MFNIIKQYVYTYMILDKWCVCDKLSFI